MQITHSSVSSSCRACSLAALQGKGAIYISIYTCQWMKRLHVLPSSSSLQPILLHALPILSSFLAEPSCAGLSCRSPSSVILSVLFCSFFLHGQTTVITVNVEIMIFWDVTLCIWIDRFQRESTISVIMVEEWEGAAGYSEIFIPGYQTTRRHVPENHSYRPLSQGMERVSTSHVRWEFLQATSIMWTTWWPLPDCGVTASRRCTSQHKTFCMMGQNRVLMRSFPCSL